jgi:hypothetical protein
MDGGALGGCKFDDAVDTGRELDDAVDTGRELDNTAEVGRDFGLGPEGTCEPVEATRTLAFLLRLELGSGVQALGFYVR